VREEALPPEIAVRGPSDRAKEERTKMVQAIANSELGTMSAGEKKRAKLARHVEDIEAIFDRREKIGSTLTAAQREFLQEVAYRDLVWYRYGHHALKGREPLPSGMDHTQRQTKAAVLAKLRSDLSDLALLAEVSGPRLEEVERAVPGGGKSRLRPWITKLDVLEVLELEDLCKIIGFAVEVFGEDYAKALTHAIESYHGTRKGESQ